MSKNSNQLVLMSSSSERGRLYGKRNRFNITRSVIDEKIPDQEMENNYKHSWPSLKEYLKVMINLSIENFFAPLREYLDQLRNNQLDPRDLYLYKNVHISHFYYNAGYIEHDLYVDFTVRWPKDPENQMQKYQWHINWEFTERLRKRSLLIFSKSKYMDTIDAVAFSCAIQGSIINNRVPIEFLQGSLEICQDYYMFEPTSYWNQVIIDNLLNTNESTIPEWIINPFLKFNFKGLQIKKKNDDQLELKTTLDEEQFKPFEFCLHNRLTLVNGAPGTGKSYLGRELVKYLIQSGYKHPIMLVTYKNITLNTFLDKMSGFLYKNNVPFIRIGALLKTKNALVKQNDYLPQIPLGIQQMKQELMYVNSLIIKLNNCFAYELNQGTPHNYTYDFLNEINKITNIRKILFEMYPIYSDEDEFLITNFLDPKDFIPPASHYFCCYSSDYYYQQLKTSCHGKVIKQCGYIIDELQKFFEKRGVGNFSNDIDRLIKYHFSDNPKLLFDYLFSRYDSIFVEDEAKSKKYLNILREIAHRSSFYASDLKDEVENVTQLTNIDLDTNFTISIFELFEKLLKTNYSVVKFVEFMKKLNGILLNRKTYLEKNIKEAMAKYNQDEKERLAYELSNKKLIAITATRAVQYKESLDKSGCKFVIFEEAGELTEAITFSIIPKTTEQIIMIGDYNQLRLKVHQEFAKDPFNHHISLFEKEVRYVKKNRIPILFTLSIQKRMHPEISSLLKPIFYNNNESFEKLLDHEITEHIRIPFGFPNHLQFWLHEYNEKPPDKFERSYINVEEAKICAYLFLLMLCRGYKSTEITILASYKGQKKQITKELAALIDLYYNDGSLMSYDAFDFENDLEKDLEVIRFLRDFDKSKNFTQLVEFRKKLLGRFVKCLDDFQGEENEVIILSLTRSSEVGFMGERNRSLVSLSRAKQMEIVVGNKNIFGPESKNILWQQISSQLNHKDRRVIPHNGITVKECCKHGKPNKLNNIKSINELLKYRFNYCNKTCQCFCNCNHQCQLPCHNHAIMNTKMTNIFDRRYFCPEKCLCTGFCGECSHYGCLKSNKSISRAKIKLSTKSCKKKKLMIILDYSKNKIQFNDFYKVFAVKNTKTNEVFLAKAFYIFFDCYSPESLNEIFNFLKIILKVNHPSIIKSFTFNKNGFNHVKNPTLFTEFYENITLNDIITDPKKLNDTKKLIHLYGIASGMSFLHSHDILHLNLVPSNIVEDSNFYPKIVDFGINGTFMDLNSILKIKNPSKYLAPECYIKGEYNKSSEVFSFSLIAYQIMMNKILFKDEKIIDHVEKITNNVRPEFDKEIPQVYRDLIEKCWAADPLKRPTFEMIVNEIEKNQKFITNSVDKNELNEYIRIIKFSSSKYHEQIEKSKKKGSNDDDSDNDYIKDKDDEEEEEEEEEKEEEEEEDFDDATLLKREMPFLRPDQIIEIKKYIKGDKIGKGITSEIYAFKKKNDNSTIHAAKIFLCNIDDSEKFKGNLIREINYQSQLTHQLVVKFIGYTKFSINNRKNPLMMLEFLKNGSLEDIIIKLSKGEQIKGWNESIIHNIIVKIALVMQFLHSKEIIHRDLKLANILLGDSFDPKLTDFGLSITTSESPNEYAGTTPYMAPEIWRNKTYSKASDVYAFAILIYEILTNKLLYRNMSNDNIMYRVNNKKERPTLKIIPKFYKDLVRSCWNDDHKKRPSFDQILDYLNTIPQ